MLDVDHRPLQDMLTMMMDSSDELAPTLPASTTATTATTKKTLQITLYASNLPRQRRGLRTIIPSTFCAVTSLKAAGDDDDSTKKKTDALLLSPAVSGVENESANNNNTSYDTNNNQRSSGHVWGKTEVVQSLHPQWTKCIFLEYTEGTQLYFYVHVFAADDDVEQEEEQHQNQKQGREHHEQNNHNNNNLLGFESSFGSAVMEVSDILSSEQCTRAKKLRKGGYIYCRVEVAKTPLHYRCYLQFSCELFQQQKRNTKGQQQEAWFEIYKAATSQNNTATWLVVYRSEVMDGTTATTSNTRRYAWDAAAELNLGSLCNGDLDKPLRIALQKQVRGSPVLLGVTETTLRHLLRMTMNHNHNTTDINSDDSNGSPSDLLKPNELFLQQNLVQQQIQTAGKLQVIQARVERDNDANVNSNNSVVSPQQRQQQQHQLLVNSNKLFESTLVLQEQATQRVDFAQLQPQSPMSYNGSTTTATATTTTLTPPPPAISSSKTFQDYIREGCVLDLCVAIDYTSSNGAPTLENSLHYQSSSSSSGSNSSCTYNDYEETIIAICNTIQPYSSKEHSVWGFGAKFPQDNGVGPVRHLFQCGTAPKVLGTLGVLDAYHSVFQSDFIMSGPTILLQVIQAAAMQARKQHNHMTNTLPSPDLRYTVLLIITDGLADEFEETQRKLAVYGQLPLSVVIVGVGGGSRSTSSDFTKMYHLCPYGRHHGTRANTTFVEFRNHQHDPTLLGAAALQNVPDQVCEYMRRRGF